jgi:hypothetical protein
MDEAHMAACYMPWLRLAVGADLASGGTAGFEEDDIMAATVTEGRRWSAALATTGGRGRTQRRYSGSGQIWMRAATAITE